VAVDKHGNLAAATSSGGIAGRMTGRVGDTAMLGAGTYAAPSGAVSCTGHGEEIIRRLLARDVVDRMTTMPASVATTLVMAEARRRKIACGVVGFDARGGICYGYTTPDMAYGYKVAERLFLFTEEKGPKPKPVLPRP
jgi:beta-aspartyl-peptidase (threonine type)